MPNDTLQIECFIEALNKYIDAKSIERKAFRDYDGYSWGYHGHRYTQDVDKAAQEVKEHFTKAVLQVTQGK